MTKKKDGAATETAAVEETAGIVAPDVTPVPEILPVMVADKKAIRNHPLRKKSNRIRFDSLVQSTRTSRIVAEAVKTHYGFGDDKKLTREQFLSAVAAWHKMEA
jgi:hypothetical protein